VEKLVVLAFLVTKGLHKSEIPGRLPVHFQFRAVDRRLRCIRESPDRPVRPEHRRQHLLVGVVVIEDRTIEPQTVAYVGLEANFVRDENFRTERLDTALLTRVVGRESTRFGTAT